MIFRKPIHAYVGLSPAYLNVGTMENKGWELALTYKGRVNKLKYTVTGLLADVQNRVTSLPTNDPTKPVILDVLNGPIVGAAKNPAIVPEKPSFGGAGSVQDLNDIPNYSLSASKRISSRNEIRLNTSKHLLWTLPLGELDKNKKLTQNPGW